MKRDMELVRDILFAIEEQYTDTPIYDLQVKDYSIKSIAYHCKILYEAGLVDDYDSVYGNDELCDFAVGSLTWEGHEFLEQIKNDTVWNKSKSVIKDKGLPFVIDVIKDVTSTIISGMTQAALKTLIP